MCLRRCCIKVPLIMREQSQLNLKDMQPCVPRKSFQEKTWSSMLQMKRVEKVEFGWILQMFWTSSLGLSVKISEVILLMLNWKVLIIELKESPGGDFRIQNEIKIHDRKKTPSPIFQFKLKSYWHKVLRHKWLFIESPFSTKTIAKKDHGR